jgi:DNA-binding beta-propeller fold protein YncE/plastocyanin
MAVALYRPGPAGIRRIRELLIPALVLAFGVVGWSHLYHTVVLGYADTAAGHTAHVLRDGLLAVPVALVALAGGLWLTQHRPLVTQAAAVAAVLGLLLVPATGLHDQIDARLAAAGQHHHLDAALVPAGQDHDAGGLLSVLEHGGRDALVAEVVALPLALLVLGRRGRRRTVRVRGVGWWPREVALASASLLVLTGAGSTGSADATADTATVHQFVLTDNPGNWFDAGVDIAGTRSLVVAAPGDKVRFIVRRPESETVHTATSLLFPTGAAGMPFDQPTAFRGTEQVRLTSPGLHVFVCKLHPFMLGGVIVDDPATPELDLGKTITLVNGATVPTASDLALRLVRAFFVITNPANYQVFSTTQATTWDPQYPAVPVLAYDQSGAPVSIPNLDAFLEGYFHEPVTLPAATVPTATGIGEVWVDTQYELTAHKTKPGAATAVDTSSWQVTKKFALPQVNLNNPHNMWTDRRQQVIYDTEWFGTALAAFDRDSGRLVANTEVGEAPAHVMTRTDTDQVHVTLNGEDAVVELSPRATRINRRIPVQRPGELAGQPHAHWMSSDGHAMATPNSNTNDSTLLDVPAGTITAKLATGTLPIATGMMPDASKYYVSNYLDSTISVVDMAAPQRVTKTINLLANYDPIGGAVTGPIGALPIQTPVSPTGKYVVTANTLTGTITIIDTDTDTLVKSLPCDAGCHGVNFAAKRGGGYLAYVSSKFSNSLIVVDPDPNNDGEPTDAAVIGRVVLTAGPATRTDDRVIANAGMGGQGVLPIPLVYNGWVQNVPNTPPFDQLTCEQRNPLGGGCR